MPGQVRVSNSDRSPRVVANGLPIAAGWRPKDRVPDAPALGAQLGWAPTIWAHAIGLKAVGVVRTDSVLSRKSSKRVQCGEPTKLAFRFYNLRPTPILRSSCKWNQGLTSSYLRLREVEDHQLFRAERAYVSKGPPNVISHSSFLHRILSGRAQVRDADKNQPSGW